MIAFDEAAVADAPREGLYQDGAAAGGAAADPDSYGAAGDGSGIGDRAAPLEEHAGAARPGNRTEVGHKGDVVAAAVNPVQIGRASCRERV